MTVGYLLQREAQDAAIRDRFDGRNYAELAAKHDSLAVRYVRPIVEAPRARRQRAQRG